MIQLEVISIKNSYPNIFLHEKNYFYINFNYIFKYNIIKIVL
jgi:hypothetical protein